MNFDVLETMLGLEPGEFKRLLETDSRLRYRVHVLSKSNRVIAAPNAKLKDVQRRIMRAVETRFQPHMAAHGYVRGKSIITNALQHTRKNILLHLDISDFFGSITKPLVAESLGRTYPELCQAEIDALAELCCHNGALPQGSPSSPVLSNLRCHQLDQQLSELASAIGCSYTRYSDDMTFSTNAAHLPVELATIRGRGILQTVELGQPLELAIARHGFYINWKKVRAQSRTERQVVTGLVVNDGLSVPKEYRRAIRAALSRWRSCSVAIAGSAYHRSNSSKAFLCALMGRIEYFGHIHGRDDTTYLAFRRSYFDLLMHG